ncbi:phage holin family protein [Xylella taiwanensis]|uniref:Phage holin family protein n=1 Tax=Xylella taiwanensis TaxID=1444770 RepID=Z9JH71_9GAMM|nr:phage holin family protein [Xylella taiwanensis]AXI83019.1 hypothetical protein AB672_03175 [Xylella taiwanensis]EWS77166.1 hypothetical protein AF72_12340 [Xylella taiwanensis]MCD8456045.1 phage holin family protein [Xylella taiwanensis]MCD8458449.1 phage holin family protein [Xylella taiwanensis]MCD8460585.1 phage holin family protein [Xylella taiwanensis]
MLDLTDMPLWKELFCVGLAMMAGTLGYCMRTLDEGGKLLCSRVLVETLSAGLVGLCVMWGCDALDMSQSITFATVGVSGLIGTSNSLEFIQHCISPKMSSKKRPSDDR